MSPKRSQAVGNRLVVIAAPSGAGKTTLCERLVQEFPDQFAISVSMTTRSPRANEVQGTHYYFTNWDTFKKNIEEGNFVEFEQVHNNWYGTLKREIDQKLSSRHLLFDIDVKGALNLVKIYQEKVLLIFIHPPSLEALKVRLESRKGNSSQDIETRLQNAYNEIGQSSAFDYQIINDNLENAYQELVKVIKRECF